MWILEGEGSRYQGLEWGGGRNNKRDLVLQEELQFVLFTVEKKKKHMWKGFGLTGCLVQGENGRGNREDTLGPEGPRLGGGEGAPRTLLPIWCVLQAPF